MNSASITKNKCYCFLGKSWYHNYKVINISFVMCAFFAWWQNTAMDVTFQNMDVTVCKKDKEISDVKNVNSLYILSFFLTNLRKLAISFEIIFIFSLNFHLFDEKHKSLSKCLWLIFKLIFMYFFCSMI